MKRIAVGNRKKRGVSLLECIFAIAVISIVSASAIGVFVTSINVTSSRWNYYQTTVIAQNALACFQASDSLEAFEDHLNDVLVSAGDKSNHAVDVVEKIKAYKEYDPSTEEISNSFTTIRAYESGKVEFYDKALETDKTYTDPVLVFNYGDTAAGKAKYEKDVHGTATSNTSALDKLNLYNATPHNKEGKYTDCTATRYYYSTYKKYTYTYNQSYSVTSTGVSISDSCAATKNGNAYNKESYSNSASFTVSDLEKNLLEEGLYLNFDTNTMKLGTQYIGGEYLDAVSFNKNNTCMYFAVYDISTKEKYVDSDKNYWYIRVKAKQHTKYENVQNPNNGQTSYVEVAYDFWSDKSNAYFVVTSVEVAKTKATTAPTADASYTALAKNDGTAYPSSWNWSGLPGFLWYCVSNVEYSTQYQTRASKKVNRLFKEDSANFKRDVSGNKEPGGLQYTDYVLKSGHSSQILYALSDASSFIAVYNNENTGSTIGRLLYQYTGSEVGDALSTLVSAYAFTNSDGRYYHLNSSDINKVIFDDTNHKIKFCQNTAEVVVFHYSDAAKYAQDKATVLDSEEGHFRGHYTYTLPTTEASINNHGECLIRSYEDEEAFSVVIKANGSTPEELIFKSNADSFSTTQTSVPISQFQQVQKPQEGVSDTVVTRSYYINYGAYICYLKVTYSKISYVLPGQDNYDPKITVWILTAEEMGDDMSTAPTAEPFLEYRKG